MISFFNCIDNAEDEPFLSIFLYQHDLHNLVKVGTCFKYTSKPTSVDLFLATKNTFSKHRCNLQ